MPCRDYSPESANTHRLNEQIRLMKARCDDYAKLLCEACNVIEAYDEGGVEAEGSIALQEWWEEHKKADRAQLLDQLRNKINHLEKDDFDKIDEILSGYNSE